MRSDEIKKLAVGTTMFAVKGKYGDRWDCVLLDCKPIKPTWYEKAWCFKVRLLEPPARAWSYPKAWIVDLGPDGEIRAAKEIYGPITAGMEVWVPARYLFDQEGEAERVRERAEQRRLAREAAVQAERLKERNEQAALNEVRRRLLDDESARVTQGFLRIRSDSGSLTARLAGLDYEGAELLIPMTKDGRIKTDGES